MNLGMDSLFTSEAAHDPFQFPNWNPMVILDAQKYPLVNHAGR